MRLHFPNIDRPKKAAKSITSAFPGIRLSQVQRAVATIIGYADWHELEKQHNAGPPFALDQDLSHERFRARSQGLASQLAAALNVTWSDALYALAISRLTGDRAIQTEEYQSNWCDLFCRHHGIDGTRRSIGCVMKLNVPGRRGEPVLLKKWGQPVELISHRSAQTCVADFQVVSPRQQLTFFVPMRLWLPYGVWTETGGARVLFSRDYKPMWRLRVERRPERVDPWLWIEHSAEEWFWEDFDSPWKSKERYQTETVRLQSFGIFGLPKLADALSPLLLERKVSNINDAVIHLAEIAGYHETHPLYGVVMS